MSIHPIMQKLAAKLERTDHPAFGPGDTIRVQVKIREGEKERLQAFEGMVIAANKGPQGTFTVRKMSFGQGVERIFPYNSTVIDRSRSCAPTRSAAPSSSTCAACAARPPACARSPAPPKFYASTADSQPIKRPRPPLVVAFSFIRGLFRSMLVEPETVFDRNRHERKGTASAVPKMDALFFLTRCPRLPVIEEVRKK